MSLDGLDWYRCTIFHREPGARLASDLISEAVALTEELWGPSPADGWVTWIDPGKVDSPHPGYCFKLAGWELDRDYVPRRVNLIRLRLRK